MKYQNPTTKLPFIALSWFLVLVASSFISTVDAAEACVDAKIDGSEWSTSDEVDGIWDGKTCNDISELPSFWCSYLDDYNSTATETTPSISSTDACCVCGGGTNITLDESAPSATPSNAPTQCQDEDGFYWNEQDPSNPLGCEKVTEGFCDDLSKIWKNGKNVMSACCACGGGKHVPIPGSDEPSITPSSEPTISPTDLPSAVPSVTISEQPSAALSSTPTSSTFEKCTDVQDWTTVDPNDFWSDHTCNDIAELPEFWCNFFANYTNPIFNDMGPGQACCACGGGTRTQDIRSKQPSEAPSDAPTRCEDQPFWYWNADKGYGCEKVTPGFCDTLSPIWYQGKNVELACCSCGGGSHVPYVPSTVPSAEPSISVEPSDKPSLPPTDKPSSSPSDEPSLEPTSSAAPTKSAQPSAQPSTEPTDAPSDLPSHVPSASPTKSPQPSISAMPSSAPTDVPSSAPTDVPSDVPSDQPTSSSQPSVSKEPSAAPSTSSQPSISAMPSSAPSDKPSDKPSLQPTDAPSDQPTKSAEPSLSTVPSSAPSDKPSTKPSSQPTSAPSDVPSDLPSIKPSISMIPSYAPSSKPSSAPSSKPSSKPSDVPTFAPSSTPTLQCYDFPMGWFDVEGIKFDCGWYGDKKNCEFYGDDYANPNFGNATANTACCVCGGGVTNGSPSQIPSMGPSATYSPTPIPAAALRAVGTGAYHTCAIFNNPNQLYCWGWNAYGQVGDGTLHGDRVWPMEVSLGTGRYAVFVALGINHSCAITNDNKTFCWGQNADGELGRTTPSWDNPSPLEVTVIPSNEYAIALAAGQ